MCEKLCMIFVWALIVHYFNCHTFFYALNIKINRNGNNKKA